MINISSNIKPNLIYKFNNNYYISYNIRKQTITDTNDVDRDLYTYDEIKYNSKPTIDEIIKDTKLNEKEINEYKQIYDEFI